MLDNRNKQVRKKQPSTSNKNTLTLDRWRFYLMWSVVLLCFLALVGRAFYVQIINKDFLQNKANANILRTEKVKAMRGVIYDRHGVPLAISTPVMKVVIDPRDYFDAKKQFEEISAELVKDPNNLHQRPPRIGYELHSCCGNSCDHPLPDRSMAKNPHRRRVWSWSASKVQLP